MAKYKKFHSFKKFFLGVINKNLCVIIGKTCVCSIKKNNFEQKGAKWNEKSALMDGKNIAFKWR